MLLALATGIVLVPDSVLERLTAASPVPATAGARSAGVAGIALWLALGAGGAVLMSSQPAAAQMRGGSGTEAPEPASVDEKWLVHNIVCQCQSCRHNLMECETEGCGHAIQDRIAIRQLLDQGRTREQIVEYFIKKYGGQVALAAPLRPGSTGSRGCFLTVWRRSPPRPGLRGLPPRQAPLRIAPPNHPSPTRSLPTSSMTNRNLD